jgi:hypothetical protein
MSKISLVGLLLRFTAAALTAAVAAIYCLTAVCGVCLDTGKKLHRLLENPLHNIFVLYSFGSEKKSMYFKNITYIHFN